MIITAWPDLRICAPRKSASSASTPATMKHRWSWPSSRTGFVRANGSGKCRTWPLTGI
jgi:hypothetical protein